jgi:hypothetical protein
VTARLVDVESPFLVAIEVPRRIELKFEPTSTLLQVPGLSIPAEDGQSLRSRGR